MESSDEILSELKYIDDVIRHIELVRQNCIFLGKKLIENGNVYLGRILIKNGLIHDASKLNGIEQEYMRYYLNKKINKAQKHDMSIAVKQHVSVNPHHPEYWGSIHDMPEIYIIEMVCDWKARATEFGTNLREWIDDEGTKRYNFKQSDSVYNIIHKYVDMLCGEPLEDIKKNN